MRQSSAPISAPSRARISVSHAVMAAAADSESSPATMAARQYLASARRHRQRALGATPDVVLMDIRMPGMDGIEATPVITASDLQARVLVLTTFDDDEYVYAALRAGASGFLVKDMALEDILSAIRVVAAGDAMIAPGVTMRLIEEFTGRPRSGLKARDVEGITEREREVLTLIGLSHSHGEIAKALHISMATAKTHVARLLSKLGARDRVQLVIVAYEAGLVSPSR